MNFKQLINIPVNRKNEGIVYVGEGIPSSRPLHIYRKTGAGCVSSNRSCTIQDKPLKMLGKNKYNSFTPPNRCRILQNEPYYHEYSAYMNRKCINPALKTTKPMYNIDKPNNKRFWQQGAVSESAMAARKKYEAVIANNQSLLDTYKINLKYSEEPVYTFKNIVAFSPPATLTSCIPPNRLP